MLCLGSNETLTQVVKKETFLKHKLLKFNYLDSGRITSTSCVNTDMLQMY